MCSTWPLRAGADATMDQVSCDRRRRACMACSALVDAAAVPSPDVENPTSGGDLGPSGSRHWVRHRPPRTRSENMAHCVVGAMADLRWLAAPRRTRLSPRTAIPHSIFVYGFIAAYTYTHGAAGAGPGLSLRGSGLCMPLTPRSASLARDLLVLSGHVPRHARPRRSPPHELDRARRTQSISCWQ
jgi:hypothetical protein